MLYKAIQSLHRRVYSLNRQGRKREEEQVRPYKGSKHSDGHKIIERVGLENFSRDLLIQPRHWGRIVFT